MRDLVILAQAGDVDAYSALTARSTDRLYAAARLILRNDDRAAEATTLVNSIHFFDAQ